MAPLPAGGCVLALGEAGLKSVTKDGRTITHADQPAFQLVVSHNGARVIAVAPRGKLSMLSKLDVPARKASSWCLAELSAFTTSFNGDTWYVAVGQDLYAIDATSPKFDALWRIPDVGVPAGPLTLTASKLSFVTRLDNQFWLWEYQHPNLRLTGKTLLRDALKTLVGPRFSACGNGAVLLSCQFGTVDYQLPGEPWEPLVTPAENEILSFSPMVTENWIGGVVKSTDYAPILIYSLEKRGFPVLRLEVILEAVPVFEWTTRASLSRAADMPKPTISRTATGF